MIRVWIEIRDEVAGFELEVRAQSIEQAVRLAGAHFPNCEVRVLFPIDPHTFFCADPVPVSETALEEAASRQVGKGASGQLA